jgi:hypothetical protein
MRAHNQEVMTNATSLKKKEKNSCDGSQGSNSGSYGGKPSQPVRGMREVFGRMPDG